MKKLFSFQIIKQGARSVWIWWLVACVGQSANFLLFPTAVETEADKSGLLLKFAEEGLALNGLIFMIIVALIGVNVLISSEVENGTLAVTLNTPLTRKQIIMSKALVLVSLIASVCVFVGVVGTVSPVLFGLGASFDFAKWWIIIAMWFLYSLLGGGIAFIFACWFNKRRYVLSVAALILGAFFMLSMISKMESFEFFKYFTLQSLFDMQAIVNGDSFVWQAIVMLVLTVPLYLAGILKFLKKDLHL